MSELPDNSAPVDGPPAWAHITMKGAVRLTPEQYARYLTQTDEAMWEEVLQDNQGDWWEEFDGSAYVSDANVAVDRE